MPVKKRQRKKNDKEAAGMVDGEGGVLLNMRVLKEFPYSRKCRSTGTALFLGTVVDFQPCSAAKRAKKPKGKQPLLERCLYRVKFDDGDVDDMDPDEVLQCAVLYHEHRQLHLGNEQKPKKNALPVIGSTRGKKNIEARGMESLLSRENRPLSSEEVKRLDEERIDYWMFFREFNLNNNIPKPMSLLETQQSYWWGKTEESVQETKDGDAISSDKTKVVVEGEHTPTPADASTSKSEGEVVPLVTDTVLMERQRGKKGSSIREQQKLSDLDAMSENPCEPAPEQQPEKVVNDTLPKDPKVDQDSNLDRNENPREEISDRKYDDSNLSGKSLELHEPRQRPKNPEASDVSGDIDTSATQTAAKETNVAQDDKTGIVDGQPEEVVDGELEAKVTTDEDAGESGGNSQDFVRDELAAIVNVDDDSKGNDGEPEEIVDTNTQTKDDLDDDKGNKCGEPEETIHEELEKKVTLDENKRTRDREPEENVHEETSSEIAAHDKAMEGGRRVPSDFDVTDDKVPPADTQLDDDQQKLKESEPTEEVSPAGDSEISRNDDEQDGGGTQGGKEAQNGEGRSGRGADASGVEDQLEILGGDKESDDHVPHGEDRPNDDRQNEDGSVPVNQVVAKEDKEALPKEDDTGEGKVTYDAALPVCNTDPGVEFKMADREKEVHSTHETLCCDGIDNIFRSTVDDHRNDRLETRDLVVGGHLSASSTRLENEESPPARTVTIIPVDLSDQHIHVPNPLGIVHFGRPHPDVAEGSGVYSRRILHSLGAHRADISPVNGNSRDGCDSILILNEEEHHLRKDDLGMVKFKRSRRNGGGAVYMSYTKNTPIRVFRRAEHLPPPKDGYRYFGLYVAIAMFDEQGNPRTEFASSDVLYEFLMKRCPAVPNSSTSDYVNAIGIDELWDAIDQERVIEDPSQYNRTNESTKPMNHVDVPAIPDSALGAMGEERGLPYENDELGSTGDAKAGKRSRQRWQSAAVTTEEE